MIYPTKLVFSFEDISYKEKVIKSILERLKRIDQSQWFIGSLKIENKTIDYKPFVIENIQESQECWNSHLEKVLNKAQAVTIYIIEDFKQEVQESTSVLQFIDMLNEENDSTLVRDYGHHIDGHVAVITDDLDSTVQVFSQHCSLTGIEKVVIYEHSQAAKCDGCNTIFSIGDLFLSEGELYCNKCK
jgi:hypothetical protein